MTDINLKFEDTVQCNFFPTGQLLENNLEELCKLINSTIESLSQDYIWQRDEFRVCISPLEDSQKDIIHLTSTTCVGDNIEDEWFIIYLLIEISKQIIDIIIQVQDADGDFILIEAADYLPSWASPNTTENRVFIYNGHIHLIPSEFADVESNNLLELHDSIRIVKENEDKTRASLEIHDAIQKRICGYPNALQENQHRAIVKLPLDIATILTLKPTLISPLVNTYCGHDMLDERHIKNVNYDNCVSIHVKFTKYLYAILRHSKIIKASKYKISENNKRETLGFKLTCGYEMIRKNGSKDIFSSSPYMKFINSLTKNGYFKNNIEGSKDYQELLDKAKSYFLNMESSLNCYTCAKIEEVQSSKQFLELKEQLRKTNETKELEEDSDDWLNIEPDQLNHYLNSKYGTQYKSNTNDPITSHTITSKLTDFLKQTSDFEGIECMNEDSFDDKIDFNSEEFVGCIDKMLKLLTLDGNKDNETEFSIDSDENCDEEDTITDLDKEISAELVDFEMNISKDKTRYINNLIQSIKEEGLTGPSSNLLKNVGISKSDLLDSDDDQ